MDGYSSDAVDLGCVNKVVFATVKARLLRTHSFHFPHHPPATNLLTVRKFIRQTLESRNGRRRAIAQMFLSLDKGMAFQPAGMAVGCFLTIGRMN